MKLKKLLVLSALAFSSLGFAAESEYLTVLVQGAGATQLDAAVRKAVDVAVNATKEVPNIIILSQSAKAYHKGQIDTYRIVGADKQTDGSWIVEIDAKIKKDIKAPVGKTGQTSEVQLVNNDLQSHLANVAAQVEKLDSDVELLKANAHLLDFTDTVKYHVALDDPKHPFDPALYKRKDQETLFIHQLSIDEDKYLQKAQKLEKVIEKIAIDKYSVETSGLMDGDKRYYLSRSHVGLDVSKEQDHVMMNDFYYSRFTSELEKVDGVFSACFAKDGDIKNLSCYLLPDELKDYFNKIYKITVSLNGEKGSVRDFSTDPFQLIDFQDDSQNNSFYKKRITTFTFVPGFNYRLRSRRMLDLSFMGYPTFLVNSMSISMKFNNISDFETLKKVKGGAFKITPEKSLF